MWIQMEMEYAIILNYHPRKGRHSAILQEEHPPGGSSFEITSSPLKGVIIIFFAIFLAALFTELAVKKGVMRKIISRYIWNVLLMAGFLISALSGVLLLFIKDASFLTLHILSSLILLWMGIYHIQYLRMLTKIAVSRTCFC